MKKILVLLLNITLIMAITFPAVAVSTITVKSITLNNTKVTLNVGQTATLEVTFTPTNTSQKKLTYVTGNKKVATINAFGEITGVQKGNTTITVYTINKKVYSKCNVTVNALKQVSLKIIMAGDKPADQQMVLDEIAKSTRNELNIVLSVDYIPWGDYLEKTKMMAAGGDEFDIFLNFGFDISAAYTRKQAIKMNELFTKYGKDIKENLSAMEIASGFVDQDQVAIPAVYTKDDIAATALIRKDLRIKYKIPEIKNLAGMAAYLDAIKVNETSMIPFGSDTYAASTFFVRAVQADKRPFKHAETVSAWYKDGKDSQVKVFNRYSSGSTEKALADICADGYNKGWFEKDVLSQKDAKGLFIAGKSAAFNTDLYNFSVVERAVKVNFPKAEVEWVILNPKQPINYSASNNFSQISSTSKNPERAMMFLNWLQKSQKNYDLYMFGIEGKHYTLENGLIMLPKGIDGTNNPYAPTPWFAYNTKWHRLTSDVSSLTISATKFLKNAPRYVDDARLKGFTFVPEKVAIEIGQCEKIISEQWYPLLIGVRSGDAAYNKFLIDLDAAGAPAIIAETQRQIDEYIAKK